MSAPRRVVELARVITLALAEYMSGGLGDDPQSGADLIGALALCLGLICNRSGVTLDQLLPLLHEAITVELSDPEPPC